VSSSFNVTVNDDSIVQSNADNASIDEESLVGGNLGDTYVGNTGSNADLTPNPGAATTNGWQVDGNLGIDRSLLHTWRGQVESDGAEAFPGNGRLKSSDEEVAQLRKDLARAQQERDILKKALAYFAKERT